MRFSLANYWTKISLFISFGLIDHGTRTSACVSGGVDLSCFQWHMAGRGSLPISLYYVDDLLVDLSKLSVGCYWDSIFAGSVCYADDLVLLATALISTQCDMMMVASMIQHIAICPIRSAELWRKYELMKAYVTHTQTKRKQFWLKQFLHWSHCRWLLF